MPHLLILLFSISTASAAPPPPGTVAGDAGQESYGPGETLTLHLSAEAAEVRVEITRLGAKPGRVLGPEAVPGGLKPVPAKASSHGCGWPVSASWTIPREWRSGYYEITLRAAEAVPAGDPQPARAAASSCFFVLRGAEDGPRKPILLELSTHTWNAYNNWGGFGLYAYHAPSGNQGHRVSTQRPPASLFGNWERPFVEWAERNGYEFDYCTNGDLEFHPEVLRGRRLLLSVGHDEYWSAPMRDRVEAHIGAGGNAAFFSGNTCCWQVRAEEGGRALTCWKQYYLMDPVWLARGDLSTLSTLWSHHLVNRPENRLTGVGFLHGGYHKSHGQLMDASGGYTVHRPDHWVFAGTDLARGAEFGAKDTVVGYECDGCEIEWKDGLPSPTHRDGTPDTFTILATAPAKWHPDDCMFYDRWEAGRTGNAVLGVYSRGGTVFTCGSTDWSHGLRGADPKVERITRNVLDTLSR